jgi:hypothetical protein
VLTDSELSHLERIAWEATKGIVGADAAIPGGDLYDGILSGLVATVEAAYRRGVAASMVQLSLLPDAAHVVG